MAENEKSGNGGQRAWLGTLLSYSGRCRGRMAGSLLASVLSVAAGFVPFYAVYRIMATAMEGRVAFEEALPWLCLAAASYVASKMLFGVSTLLSHVSAYTILETLRRDFIEKLMRASLGTVQEKSIGQIKNVFLDRIEGVEVPLAHMIPELSGSALLALGLAAWLVAILAGIGGHGSPLRPRPGRPHYPMGVRRRRRHARYNREHGPDLRRHAMDLSRIDARLLSRPGATKALHEKWGWMVYWVGGRQFACEFVTSPDAKPPYAGRHLLSLKCDPDRILELRAEHPGAVLPGYYSDGRTWVSVDLDSDLPEELVLDLCDMSYDLVLAKLPKRVQREVSGG